MYQIMMLSYFLNNLFDLILILFLLCSFVSFFSSRDMWREKNNHWVSNFIHHFLKISNKDSTVHFSVICMCVSCVPSHGKWRFWKKKKKLFFRSMQNRKLLQWIELASFEYKGLVLFDWAIQKKKTSVTGYYSNANWSHYVWTIPFNWSGKLCRTRRAKDYELAYFKVQKNLFSFDGRAFFLLLFEINGAKNWYRQAVSKQTTWRNWQWHSGTPWFFFGIFFFWRFYYQKPSII